MKAGRIVLHIDDVVDAFDDKVQIVVTKNVAPTFASESVFQVSESIDDRVNRMQLRKRQLNSSVWQRKCIQSVLLLLQIVVRIVTVENVRYIFKAVFFVLQTLNVNVQRLEINNFQASIGTQLRRFNAIKAVIL